MVVAVRTAETNFLLFIIILIFRQFCFDLDLWNPLWIQRPSTFGFCACSGTAFPILIRDRREVATAGRMKKAGLISCG
jgi:hypothetical protein